MGIYREWKAECRRLIDEVRADPTIDAILGTHVDFYDEVKELRQQTRDERAAARQRR